jgi:AcrR family transcriptional regulator
VTDARVSTRSRENTRARLLDAAFEVFAEVGLDAASVEAICERAGFTRGAFYSNFDSKDELFLELVATVSEQKLAAVTARVRELAAGEARPTSPAEIVQQVVDVSVDSRSGVLLMSEIRIKAMRDPRTAAAYRDWQNGMVDRVEGIIRELVDVYGLPLRMPAGEFARIVLATWETTSVEAVIDGLDFDATCALVSRRTQELAVAVVDGFDA